MFDQSNNRINLGREPDNLPTIDGLSGTLLFIAQKPMLGFDVVKLEDGSSILTPKMKQKYEFYIYRVNAQGNDLFYRLSFFEKAMCSSRKIFTKHAYALDTIPESSMAEAKDTAIYLGAGAKFKIEIDTNNDTIGYSIFLDGAPIGFFSEYGDMKNCETDTYGFLHFDFGECPTLIKRSKDRIKPCVYEYEMDAIEYSRLVSRNFYQYIYDKFCMLGYRVVGVSSDEKTIIIQSNTKDTKGEYKYYELNTETFWIAKVNVKPSEHRKGYITTFINEYLGDIREYSSIHPLCGLYCELLKGVSLNKQNEITAFYAILSIGGEIRNFQKIEKDS